MRLFKTLLLAGVLIPAVIAGTASASEPSAYLSAVALNVKDLAKSTAFYEQVFGMKVNRSYNTEAMNENIMGFSSGEGASLVLVQYKDRVLPAEKQARVVFYATDPKAVIDAGVKLGATIVREPREVASMNTMIGIMRDLDGYAVEVIRRKD